MIGTTINNRTDARILFNVIFILTQPPNGLRYLRVGGRTIKLWEQDSVWV